MRDRSAKLCELSAATIFFRVSAAVRNFALLYEIHEAMRDLSFKCELSHFSEGPVLCEMEGAMLCENGCEVQARAHFINNKEVPEVDDAMRENGI